MDYKELAKAVLLDTAKSTVAAVAVQQLRIGERLDLGEGIALESLASGAINYGASEVIDMLTFGKPLDLVQGNLADAVDGVVYFGAAHGLGRVSGASEMLVDTYGNVGLTQSNAELLTSASVLTASRLGRRYLEAVQPGNYLTNVSRLVM